MINSGSFLQGKKHNWKISFSHDYLTYMRRHISLLEYLAKISFSDYGGDH